DYSDTYKINLPVAGSLVPYLSGLGEGLMGSVAVDANKNGLLDSGETLATFSKPPFARIPVPAGTVYVTISAPTATETSYDLFLAADFAGDTPQTARDLGTLVAFVQADDFITPSPADLDFYKFKLSSTQSFTPRLE